MNRWLVLTVVMAILMGIQSSRADDAPACPEGRAIFGKMICTTEDSEPVLDAFFFGATSISEVRANFPVRAAKLGERCRKKLRDRRVGSLSPGAVREREKVRFRIETVDACLRKRGFDQPCVRDEDCLEHFCHRERGACTAVFTVPISAAQ